MKKMATFIIHGGYGKTATTFLQKNIFAHLDDVLFLGKHPDEKMLTEEIHALYYALFPSFVGADKFSIHACNSSLLIHKLGDILIREMKESTKKIIVLSNENLIDYGDYNGELNQFLLLKLYRYLQDHCEEQIDFKVMMTLRNQKEHLKSCFAYDYTNLKNRFKTFESLILYGMKYPHKAIFGGYHYDIIFDDMQNIFGSGNVRFFIYEKMKEDTRAYLDDILNFIGTRQDIDTLNYKQKVNVNSQKDVHNIREIKYSFVASLLMKIYMYGKSYLEPLETSSAFQSLKETLKSYSHGTTRVVNRGHLHDFPESLIADFDSIYADGNSRLAYMLREDIEKYGYTGGRYSVGSTNK